jgi:hypothetical protein
MWYCTQHGVLGTLYQRTLLKATPHKHAIPYMARHMQHALCSTSAVVTGQYCSTATPQCEVLVDTNPTHGNCASCTFTKGPSTTRHHLTAICCCPASSTRWSAPAMQKPIQLCIQLVLSKPHDAELSLDARRRQHAMVHRARHARTMPTPGGSIRQ